MVDTPTDIHPAHKHVDGTSSDAVATPSPTVIVDQSTNSYSNDNPSYGGSPKEANGFSVKPAFDMSSQQKEPWYRIWHIGIAYCYILICLMDFVGFPLLSMFIPIIMKTFGIIIPYTPWISLTLSNGGMLHAAFGAILGVSAYTRFSDSRGNY